MLGGTARIHSFVVIGLSNVVKPNPTRASHQRSVHCIVQTDARKRVVAVNEEEIKRLSLQQLEHLLFGCFVMGVAQYDFDFTKPGSKVSYSLMNGSADAAIVNGNFLAARQGAPKCKRTATVNADFENVSRPGRN